MSTVLLIALGVCVTVIISWFGTLALWNVRVMRRRRRLLARLR